MLGKAESLASAICISIYQFILRMLSTIHFHRLMKTIVLYAFRQCFKTFGITTAFIMAANCNPVYSIGVRGTLTQPLGVDCILNAAQTTEGVQRVLIRQNKPRGGERVINSVDDFIDPPMTYLVTTIDQHDAQIEQRQHKDGRATLWVGRQGVGVMPSHHTIEAAQTFHVRLASHIAEVCKAPYSGGITCVPASEACQNFSSSPHSH